MIQEHQLKQLDNALKQIFSMPISRFTFREVQTAFSLLSQENQVEASALYEMLLTGQAKESKIAQNKEMLEKLIDNYSIPARMAKEVFEKGEFINLATSDVLSQQNKIAFLNRIRRVDGQELQFLSDIHGTASLVNHFLSRLQEAQKQENAKASLDKIKNDLSEARKKIDLLLQ